jgi:carbamoyltransferase
MGWVNGQLHQFPLEKEQKIKVLKELKFPHSLGLLYSAFTYYLGFRVNSGEYKLMGLAPYGNPADPEVKKFEDIIKTNLIDIAKDGSIWLNQKYFNYASGLRMVYDKKWAKLLGVKKRKTDEQINQTHCNLSLAIQNITEEVVKLMALEAKKLSGSDNLCLAGGVALNCVSNGKLQAEGIFKNIFIQPAAGDAGGALGAALAAYYLYFENERTIGEEKDEMQGGFLGPSFSENEIRYVLNKYSAVGEKMNYDSLYKFIAKQIDAGHVVGWMQGRMEFGPRALGARSILGDPRNAEMQKKLNLKIKYRESFRPFAPSVLEEDAANYFDMKSDSPYMLMVYPVLESRRNKLPEDYASNELKNKLYFNRSDIPAVTHVDFSARIQTVSKKTNEHFWQLIKSFKDLTGYGLLINTSFNVRGEPIVCSPEDGYRCFMRTEMDFLVIGNYVFNKIDQPGWEEKSEWQEEFVLD